MRFMDYSAEAREKDDGMGLPCGETLDVFQDFSDDLTTAIQKRTDISLTYFLRELGQSQLADFGFVFYPAVASGVVAAMVAHGYLELTEKGRKSLVVEDEKTDVDAELAQLLADEATQAAAWEDEHRDRDEEQYNQSLLFDEDEGF